MAFPTPDPSLDERYVTLAYAVAYLDCSLSHVGNLIKRGDLPSYQFGPRRVRVRFSDLEALLVPVEKTTVQP